MPINCNPYLLNMLMNEINNALTALDLACAISSELEFFPETENLPGLHELHNKALVPMSYHLVTPRGAIRIMINQQCRYSLFLLTVNCLFNTLKAAAHMAPNLKLMRESVPVQFKDNVNMTEIWSMKTIDHTRNGLEIARNIAGPYWPKVLEYLHYPGGEPMPVISIF